MSYQKIEIWQLARELVIDIHNMTLEKLPITSSIQYRVSSIKVVL